MQQLRKGNGFIATLFTFWDSKIHHCMSCDVFLTMGNKALDSKLRITLFNFFIIPETVQLYRLLTLLLLGLEPDQQGLDQIGLLKLNISTVIQLNYLISWEFSSQFSNVYRFSQNCDLTLNYILASTLQTAFKKLKCLIKTCIN